LALPITGTRTAGSLGRRGRRRRGASADRSTVSEDIAASYARYSSDNQRQESISDQQRRCNDLADTNDHRILPEFEYADEAVSGTKLRRDGLDAMLRDGAAGEFQVLYSYSLSRLARESVITMPILKRLVYAYKIRVISVTEGIDSDRDNWEVIASVMSLLHERYVKELAENVRRGQEGAVLAGFSVGDHCFGYTSVPIPGSEKTRKGRDTKPRMVYAIDDVTYTWVIRIFQWFVGDRQSLRSITRELNRRGAPKDHRASTKHWHHTLVADLLANEKYIGIWRWGEMKNTRDPETGQIRQEPRAEEECEKWRRELPDLRIIDDQTFAEAQKLLQENYDRYAANRRTDGTLKSSCSGGTHRSPRHLLSGLVKCGECGSRFYVGGTNGKYLFCPNYSKGVCSCQTRLRRDRAERMILDEIGKRILNCATWSRAVYEQTLKAWKNREDHVPTELAAAERALTDAARKISRLVDKVENGLDDPDIKRRLDDRRTERRELVKRVEQLKRAANDCGQAPTEEWVREQLQNLGETLQSDTPAAAYALRDLLDGEIVVTEIRGEGRKRFSLQGRFHVRSNGVANAVSGVEIDDRETATQEEGITEEIVIHFVDPNPLDAAAAEAKELYDQGLMNAEIAQRLGCSRGQVTKRLKHWFESRGLSMPDGRSRRAQLSRKHMEMPLYQQISEPAMKLSEEKLLIAEIAERLDVDRNTVTSAIKYWHESRGLEVPDGRTRRKTLDRKSRPSGPTRDDVDDTLTAV